MSRRAELETTLRAAPGDLDTLRVYADLLMSEGDGRGEQIMIELRDPNRLPLVKRWLASHLAQEPGGDHLHVTDERSIPFLAAPIGAFCRGVSATVRVEQARKIVDALALAPRPFLTKIKLYAGNDGPVVLDDRHVAAMPNLVELDLDDDFDLRAFRHPAVTKMRRASWAMNGLKSWVRPYDLPRCEELVVDVKPWTKTVDPATVAFHGLPALRTLDVSECEPQHLAGAGERANVDVFRWLVGLPCVTRLTKLRVPSVRTHANATQLALVIARAPHAAIEVVRTYSRCAAGLELAGARVRFAPPWPWLPENEEHAHWKYRLTGPHGVEVDMLSGAIGHGLVRTFDRGSEAYRDDWRTIWRALDGCSKLLPKKLPLSLVLRAFAGFPDEDIGSAKWLRDEILALADKLASDAVVSVAPG